MKNVIIILCLFVFSSCVSTSTFNETTQNINSRIYSLESQLNATSNELSQTNHNIEKASNDLRNLRLELDSIINSNRGNSEKLDLLDKQLRKLDEIIGKLRLELIRSK